jgi:hypothetical protein
MRADHKAKSAPFPYLTSSPLIYLFHSLVGIAPAFSVAGFYEFETPVCLCDKRTQGKKEESGLLPRPSQD